MKCKHEWIPDKNHPIRVCKKCGIKQYGWFLGRNSIYWTPHIPPLFLSVGIEEVKEDGCGCPTSLYLELDKLSNSKIYKRPITKKDY